MQCFAQGGPHQQVNDTSMVQHCGLLHLGDVAHPLQVPCIPLDAVSDYRCWRCGLLQFIAAAFLLLAGFDID